MAVTELLMDIWRWTAANPVPAFFIMLAEFAILFEVYHRAQGTAFEKPVKVMGVLVFVPQDWIMNLWLSVLFLDLPAKPFELVTGRMQRYKREYRRVPYGTLSRLEHWRYGFALRLCDHLNRRDPEHC